ncbi:MAG: ABC transporter substrate-binding protein [Betaproteobacteria bacterium RIFCSPLOWO2_02_FULL_62_17]|nr:MAG: ABC transporter substrate-binding protein [Betaproteobacteria bacterium RIFCSPLOWO2_02_FULL_62_17]
MKIHCMKSMSRVLLATALLGMAPAVLGQAWPSKPVRILNPFPAGGGTDTFVRPYAVKMSQAFGQQFIVENQGGAGGTVGARNAARAGGDGYTLFSGAVHHTIAESFYPNRGYVLEKDFMPISMLSAVPNVVVIHPKHPFKTLGELITYAKANPGKLNFGSAGPGTSHHLGGELFGIVTGVKLVHVPYQGAGPLMLGLVSGVVDMAFDGMGTSANQIKAGKIRPLALTVAQRSPLLPDVPTAAEAGVPGFQVSSWYGMWAVSGTPQPVIGRLHAETVKFLQQQDIKDIWTSQGAEAGGQPPDQFATMIRGEITKWAKVVKDGNIKLAQ